MDKSKYKSTRVYKDLGISDEDSIEDAFTATRLAGNMRICGYGMEDVITEIATMDVSIERKLLIMGAVIQSNDSRVFDHQCAEKMLCTTPFG